MSDRTANRTTRVLVTGGAGFVGSNFIYYLMGTEDVEIANLDLLTYAGHLGTLAPIAGSPRYRFQQGDISNPDTVQSLLQSFRPDYIVNFAAESHVDRSIDGPGTFIRTNINGTFVLLQCALDYWRELSAEDRAGFRYLQVSTDEVFGSLGPTGYFSETSRYDPRSPYSASKAAADHLVSAWHHTYGLPTLTTQCSNNYGPFQFPEKLIPLTILNAIDGKPIPIYGTGQNVRDWLFVGDHCDALWQVLQRGYPGATYTIGGNSERSVQEVVDLICLMLDEYLPGTPHRPHANLQTYVPDRPGHDFRYAIDSSRLKLDTGWTPTESFESGLAQTIIWYLNNLDWSDAVKAESQVSEARPGVLPDLNAMRR